MRSLGQKPSLAEVEMMVKEIDADGNGEIDFPEFLTMMLRKMNEGNPEAELREVFSVFDKSGTGTVTANDLRAAMSLVGEKLTREEVDDVIRLADTSGDGKIDYDEFIRFILQD